MSGRKDPRGQSPYLQPVRSQGGSASGGGGSVAGAAPAGAKEAITAVVRQLRGLGVGVRPGISAELLRKAKFDSPDAVGPLRRALHDLVLLSLAGFPPSSSKALEAFWRGRETPAESTDLPPPAAVLLHHYLHAWGCPLEELLLGGRSGRGCVSSRLLLLCFGWLVAQTGALEAALRHSLAEARTSHPPSSEFHMPWADDTSSSAEALAAAKAAEAAAAGFAAEISGVPGSGAGWAAVEAKQHSAMMLFGRVRALLVSLGALQLARHKRIDQCFNLQKDLNNSLGPGAYGNVLTPFEMNLAKSSTKATAAAEWLEAEAAVEEEVVEAAKHARVFFAWIRSASEAISTKEATVEAPSPPPNTPPSMEELEHEVAARAEALEVGVPEMLSTLRQGRGSSVIASGGVNARPTLSNLLRSARERLSQSAEPPLAPGDPPLPEHLARRVEEVIEWHRKLETLEEPPWHHIHRPTKGGLQPPEGCSLTPASEELAALRVSNLAVAKRLAALRASAKRQNPGSGSASDVLNIEVPPTASQPDPDPDPKTKLPRNVAGPSGINNASQRPKRNSQRLGASQGPHPLIPLPNGPPLGESGIMQHAPDQGFGYMQGGGEMHPPPQDIQARQMTMQMTGTLKKLQHCLLTLSQLAGSDDDTQALINLSPADLSFMDTNALCDKFKTSIMQIMGTRG